MTDITVRQQKNMLRRETAAWQRAAVGLFGLSLAANLAMSGLHGLERQRLEKESERLQSDLQRAEHIRDLAVRELGALSAQVALDKQARMEQAAAYEAIGAYQYIGECTITYYCPCEECCGRWADGLTATGVPAEPGVVAVDESIIPIGSTVVIDGQKYLAADTGVTGYHVDICVTDHRAAEVFGMRTEEVWVVEL